MVTVSCECWESLSQSDGMYCVNFVPKVRGSVIQTPPRHKSTCRADAGLIEHQNFHFQFPDELWLPSECETLSSRVCLPMSPILHVSARRVLPPSIADIH